MVNCSYALVVNTDLKPVYFRNTEGVWSLQASVLMNCWERSEAPLNDKELRLEINIDATKSNADGTHTCHDIIFNAYDANCGTQYGSVSVCVTIIDGKPFIVGEKVGKATIMNSLLSNVSVSDNTATILTTNIENAFWSLAYDSLPWEDFQEEVALRDLREDEAGALFSDLADRLFVVVETGAITTNNQEIVAHISKVATTAYVRDELTIAGPAAAAVGGILIASQVNFSKYYYSSDRQCSFTNTKFSIGQESLELDTLNRGNSCRSYYKFSDGKISILISTCGDLEKSKKNLKRSNNDYSVTGSEHLEDSELCLLGAADFSSRDVELLSILFKQVTINKSLPDFD